MPHTAPVKWHRAKTISVALAAAFSIGVWLQLFSFPITIVGPTLDTSWAAALVYFATHGVQFGRDVIFSYGPLGYVVGECYTGTAIPISRVAWAFVAPTILTAVAVIAIGHVPWRWRIVTAFYLLFFFRADLSVDTFYFFATFATAVLLLRYGIQNPILNGVAALFGVIALIKASYLLATIGALLPVLFLYAARRAVGAAGILLGTFAVGFVLSWALAGQAIANLPAFLTAWFEVASGYKEAMGMPPANSGVVIAGAVSVVMTVVLCISILARRRSSADFAAALLLGIALYLAWNRAFIRADDHVAHFFTVIPPLTALAISFTTASQRTSVAQQIGITLLFATGVAGIYSQRASNLTHCMAEFASRSARSAQIVVHLRSIEPSLREEFSEQAERFALPRVRQEIGSASIDVFGYEQGIAIINGFNYRARFAFQSYSAYTPQLLSANARFYASASAPQYVLMKLQAIDGRYPAGDDSGALLELMKHYEPLFEERGYWLWRRNDIEHDLAMREVAHAQIKFGDELNLPRPDAVFLRLNFRKSIAGRLLNAFYRPPVVSLRIRDLHGNVRRFRLIPSTSAAGLIVSPALLEANDVVNLDRGRGGLQSQSVALEIEPHEQWFYRPRVGVRVCVASSMPHAPSASP